MPEFTLMSAPVLAPGRCLGCGGHSGPVVDLMIRPDDPAFSMYLCERCVVEAARLVGWVSPDDWEKSLEALREEVENRERLEEQLEWERANKVVAVSDMAQLIDRIRDSSASTPVGNADLRETSRHEARTGRKVIRYEESDGPLGTLRVPVFEADPMLCSETKVNGEPCTAEALPGRDVCLAHSKRRAATGAGT